MTLQATPERALRAQRSHNSTYPDTTGGICPVAGNKERMVFGRLVDRNSSPISRWQRLSVIYDSSDLPDQTLEFVSTGSVSWIAKNVRVHMAAPNPTHAAKTVAQQVSAIRAVFALNMTQIAKSLKVARVTVYEWMRSDATPTLHEASRMRLNDLYRCAVAWQAQQSIMGSYLQEFIPSLNTTVEELLLADDLDVNAFLLAHAALMNLESNFARIKAHQKKQITALEATAKNILANAEDLGVVLD